MEWEQIDDYHKRAKIKGGWLVKAYEDILTVLPDLPPELNREWRISMCFVPDPMHAWAL